MWCQNIEFLTAIGNICLYIYIYIMLRDFKYQKSSYNMNVYINEVDKIVSIINVVWHTSLV